MKPEGKKLYSIIYTDLEGKEQSFHLIDKIQADCARLGTILGLEYNTLKGIDKEYRSDMPGFCNEILQKWITRAKGEHSVTWSGLLDALKAAQLGGIATDLEKALDLFYQ